jgi:hypothetical protein
VRFSAARHVIILSLTVPLLLAACGGRRITNDNIEALNRLFDSSEKEGRGLTPKEVESVLGQPNRTQTFKLEVQTAKPVLQGVRYYYKQDGESLELHFIDNKLISKVPLLSEPVATPAEKEK